MEPKYKVTLTFEERQEIMQALSKARNLLLQHDDVRAKIPYFVELFQFCDEALEMACLAPCVISGKVFSRNPDYGNSTP